MVRRVPHCLHISALWMLLSSCKVTPHPHGQHPHKRLHNIVHIFDRIYLHMFYQAEDSLALLCGCLRRLAGSAVAGPVPPHALLTAVAHPPAAAAEPQPHTAAGRLNHTALGTCASRRWPSGRGWRRQ
jgi:hypothetical protein